MTPFVRPLLVLRALAALSLCFFECSEKHLIFPFFFVVFFWPNALEGIFHGVWPYALPALGIPLALVIIIRPVFRLWPRTDWRSQIGPIGLWLWYVGNLLWMRLFLNCWTPDYLYYAVVPPAVFLLSQIAILLANKSEEVPRRDEK
jgi:hypothetical protein